MGLAKNYEVIKALMPYGLDGALSMRITVGALCRDGHAANAAAGKEELPLLREQRIAIVHQEPRAPEKAIGWITKVANDLDHPCFIGINTNASNVNDARLQLDDEEDHVPDGAEATQCFYAEEVASVKGRPVVFEKSRPRLLLDSFRRWFEARIGKNVGDCGAAECSWKAPK